MYLMNVAIVYGYHVSAQLHCIRVLYKCYVFLLHYITALLTLFFSVFFVFFCFWKG